MIQKKAAFLDRDGTIIKEMDYLSRVEQIQLLPGVVEAIRMLNGAKIPVVVVSNQSGVARGYFTEETVSKINKALTEILQRQGAFVDKFYYCPHHPDGQPPYNIACECRKPAPGMVKKAAAELDLNIEASVMIGDKVSDIQTGQRLQMATVLVKTGYGEEELQKLEKQNLPGADYCAENLLDAVSWWIRKCER